MKTIITFLMVVAFSGSLIAQEMAIVPDKLKEPDATKVPWDGIETGWQNGADRRDSSVFKNTSMAKYFMPYMFLDIAYTRSEANPIDNTVVGSTALARDNEVQLNSLNFGADLFYGNARGRFMTQFGTRSEVVPRNDLSPYKGQYDLADVYRYLAEAYAGYHFNVWYGINIDMGMFMSYVGLNSYYQNENWEYQASYTSDNTPWFFNGIRTQIWPTKYLKIEPWIINGWQSYGMFNSMPGFGGNITWMPSSRFKILTNDYYGTDDAGIPGRKRFHSDNSYELRYFNNPKSKKISKAAFSLTVDFGNEKGAGVNGFNNSEPLTNPAQYFLSAMVYHRLWFDHDHYAWTIGGGVMDNPGRYLVLAPTGEASPFPNPYNPTQPAGLFPFTENPGDQFKGWDMSTNFDFMPNQSLTFRIELVTRHASVPYFAGHGGVTSSTGYTTTPVDPNGTWRPDLVKDDNRIIFVMLFRL
jgi:hypothetical protein